MLNFIDRACYFYVEFKMLSEASLSNGNNFEIVVSFSGPNQVTILNVLC